MIRFLGSTASAVAKAPQWLRGPLQTLGSAAISSAGHADRHLGSVVRQSLARSNTCAPSIESPASTPSKPNFDRVARAVGPDVVIDAAVELSEDDRAFLGL
jgi:hypothetical protein